MALMNDIQLKFYNTEKRVKETLPFGKEERVKLYTCGPTIYDFAHIGNFRTYVFEDLLKRTLKFFDYPVKHVMNLTDVEDKTIKRALEKKMTLLDFTSTYKLAFFEDLETLNIEPADLYPAATDHIEEMIKMIETLIEKGFAYQGSDGNVFFRIDRFPSYGRLSHLHLSDLKTGASERVSSDEYDKETVADFVLWKAYDKERDGDNFWESPFGKGRPGWHIECSAMAIKHLGESIDIHVGGVDNIFPHHENEIAQSECCSGLHFVKLWMHSEHLIVNGKKMSKSLGNFYTLRDLLEKGFTGSEIRYLLLQTHYKTQLNFTLEGLEGARHALSRLQDFVHRLKGITSSHDQGLTFPLSEKLLLKFKMGLADDLNISQSLAALFDFVREINSLCDQDNVGKNEAAEILSILTDLDRVLGVIPLKEKELQIPPDVQEAFEKRQQARQDKNWELADKMRDLIHKKGYLIEDTPSGPRLKQSP